MGEKRARSEVYGSKDAGAFPRGDDSKAVQEL